MKFTYLNNLRRDGFFVCSCEGVPPANPSILEVLLPTTEAPTTEAQTTEAPPPENPGMDGDGERNAKVRFPTMLQKSFYPEC